MVRIAKYNIEIGAGAKGVTRAFSRVEKQSKRLRSSVKQALTFSIANFVSLDRLGSVLFRIGKLVSGFDHFAGLDRLAKDADKLGISAKSLQVYTKAAELAGIEQQTFVDGMRDIIRRVAEAESGLGSATDIFKSLKIDPIEFGGLDTGGQLGQLQTAFRAIQNDAQAVRLAMELAGDQGVAFLNLFRGDTIADAEQFFEGIGGAISRRELALVEQANDAWSNLVDTFKVLQQRIIIGVAPVLANVAKLAQRVAAAIRIDPKTITDSLTSFISAAEEFFGGMETITKGFVTAAAVMLDVAETFEAYRLAIFGGTDDELLALAKMADRVKELHALANSPDFKLNFTIPKSFTEGVNDIMQKAVDTADAADSRLDNFADKFDKSVTKLRNTLAPSLIRGSSSAVSAAVKSRFDTNKLERETKRNRRVLEQVERNTRVKKIFEDFNVSIESTIMGV